MRHLRIFNDARKRIFDLPNVDRTQLLAGGALQIELDPYFSDDDEECTRVLIAHGQWAFVQEIRDLPPDTPEPAPDDSPFTALESVPFIPGKGFLAGLRTDLGPTTGSGDEDPSPIVRPISKEELLFYRRTHPDSPQRPESDAERVHRAMQIHCRCDVLRCPVVLNEASRTDKRRARWRMFNTGSTPFTGEPLQRCSLPISHDPDTEPHRWVYGEWIYGPAQHHPDCPRHPDRYNRPAEEGQPTPAGLTSTEQLADQIMANDTMVTEIFGKHSAMPDRELVRGYVTAALPVLAGNSGPGIPASPAVQQVNDSARDVWRTCCTMTDDGQHYCGLPIGHDKGYPDVPPTAHETTTPGGDRLRW